MDFKKRIHIAPVGFEVDRIVLPAIDTKADKVYLLVHNKKTEDKAGPYINEVIKQLKANKIESEKVVVNWRDVESITKATRKLLLELMGNDIFVNISSGSKNHAIALDRAIMTLEDHTGIIEFYAESEKYEGFTPGKKQLSSGVRETKQIPKRKMVLPGEGRDGGRLLAALIILFEKSEKRTCTFPCKEKHQLQGGKHSWGEMTKNTLAKECANHQLSNGETIIPPGGNILTSLDKQIIQKLEKSWDYITIRKVGNTYRVGLTTLGMAFVYEMTP